MKGMLVGGSAAPRAMIAGFKQRHGLSVVHGWGMTETSPVASTAQLPGALVGGGRGDAVRLHRDAGASRCRSSSFAIATSTGRSCPGTARRWASSRCAGRGSPPSYYDTPDQAERWTDDGWFKTGDVVSIHPLGFIQIKDRSKDVIKSGGEWISSVELENALMAHPAIMEAAVIAVPDEKWDERPLAAVVLREGASATGDELRAFLAPDFAKFWLPDRFEFIAEIPKTSVGKFRKTELREMFAQAPSPRRPRREPAVKAVVLREVDGALALEDVPEPTGPHVVEVRAAGVNYADVLIRRGLYPQMPELPFVPGNEVAGLLDGRRVVAFPLGTGGGYAERAAVDPAGSFPLPDAASFAAGAAFLLTYLTAYIPLHRQVRVTPPRPCSSTPARAGSARPRSSSPRTSARA